MKVLFSLFIMSGKEQGLASVERSMVQQLGSFRLQTGL